MRKFPTLVPIDLTFTMQTQMFRIEGQTSFQKKLSLVRLSKAPKATADASNKINTIICDASIDLAKYYGSNSRLIECAFDKRPGLIAVCKLSVNAEQSS